MEHQMSVKEWVITLILLAIPIVNIVFLIMWGFGRDNPRKNYARAALIVYSCIIGVAIFLGAITTMMELSNESNQSYNNESNNFGAALLEANQVANEWIKEDIEILEVGLEDSEHYGIELVGKLRNNSIDRTYSSMVIKGNAYDESGSILHTFEIRISDSIPPGEVYRFSDWTINNSAKSVKIIDVFVPYF